MRGRVEYLDARWYPQHSKNWDDTLLRERILQRIAPQHSILDLGAGAGIVQQMNFKGLVHRVCGVDLDPRVLTNPHLDEAKVGSGEGIPWGNDEFDLVFADNVLEHLSEPEKVFREVHRVLRPGGRFIVKTPNKWHYMPLIARLTPHAFHRFYNRLRGRDSNDTFATHYRANSRQDLARLARVSGLNVTESVLIEGRPEYLRLSAFTYALGFAYERVVNFSESLAAFRVLLIAEFRKPEGA